MQQRPHALVKRQHGNDGSDKSKQRSVQWRWHIVFPGIVGSA
jgi:hypothetical protein